MRSSESLIGKKIHIKSEYEKMVKFQNLGIII